MRPNSLIAYQNSLKKIFSLVSSGQFLSAEQELLDNIQNILFSKSYKKKEVIQFIESVYVHFNSFYFKWLTKSGARIRVTLSDLYTKEHNNYFIGNCSDPAGMDDLLYELLHHVEHESGDDINNHYECYVARLKKEKDIK